MSSTHQSHIDVFIIDLCLNNRTQCQSVWLAVACFCLRLFAFACVCSLFRACPYRAGDYFAARQNSGIAFRRQLRLELVTHRCDCTEHVAGKPLTGVEA